MTLHTYISLPMSLQCTTLYTSKFLRYSPEKIFKLQVNTARSNQGQGPVSILPNKDATLFHTHMTTSDFPVVAPVSLQMETSSIMPSKLFVGRTPRFLLPTMTDSSNLVGVT